ncbi:ATP-dependent DNA ligase [Serinibacter arcticus]|uniref:DNA ligase (ATP) n=1 Tax=Serinibacter arcticus TaxID=1655435 RepID=A0A4Z1E0M6_9MICO|nr:ATP-dependent DNA ligase [Serinibacter arcticus]TGO05454.1 ATP-dependent DNA ligase [Serinibacter arcticus]
MTLPLAAPLAPMLAKSVPTVPGPDVAGGPFAYEPKWDGFRAIVLVDDGEVEILSRSGKSMTRYFPDVVEAARAELPARVVVDGEIVLARGSRLDFELLGQRIHPADSRVRMLAEHAPANLVVFDVLALGDDVVMDRSLAERIEVLDGLGLVGPRVHATPRTLDAALAREWLGVFEGAGLDGVMAKPLGAPYAPGKRTMLKIKHARTADVVLAGYREHKASTPEEPLVGSLLLGLYDDGGALQFVGVSASFPMARRAELVAELAPLVVDTADREAAETHPWATWSDPADAGKRQPGAQSRWSAGKDLSFTPLRPERVLEVGYDHMEGSRFRHTTQLKRWRPDREPLSCTYEQLEEPVGYDLSELLPGAPAAPESFTGSLDS